MMKRIFVAAALAGALMAGCSYDDSDLWDKVDDIDSRLENLEKKVERLNGEITSLQTIVAALDNGWKVTGVDADAEKHTITFANGQRVEIPVGSGDPEAAALGIFSENDVWYWCINALGGMVPLRDDKGANVPVESGRVGVDAEGYWTLNNGAGAVRIKDAAGAPIAVSKEKKESLFAGVEQTDDEVIFILADGTTLHVAKTIEKEVVTITFADGLNYELKTGGTRAIAFTVASKRGAQLSASSVAGSGWKSRVLVVASETGCDGTLTVTAPNEEGEDRVTVFISDNNGGVWMAVVQVSCSSVVDLSAVGTANCYLVAAPGKYSFDASVRGNGVGEEAATGFVPQIELAVGMTADWLWTDKAGLVSEVALNAASGRITFTLGEGKGNVLVALMQDGAVVWSWHIWATDMPQSVMYENGAVLMDRNLGAVGVTPGGVESYGMYYQWGRKDPFYGGEKTETSAEAFLQAKGNTTFNPTYAELTWVYSGTATTPFDAAAHPTIFYNGKVGTGFDWLTRPMAKMWSAEKSLNDPCPAGYRVPDADAWDNFHANHNYINDVSVWDGSNYGMTYAFGGQTSWYPAQGYRMYSSGSIVGLRASTGGSGAYWSSKASATKAYYLFFRSKISSGSINPDLDKERSFGYSVRCRKE